MRHTLSALCLIGTLALPTAALAQPAPRPAPATFFIVEAQAGYGVGSVFAEAPDGFASRLTIGAGGKLVGFPTRFYGIVNLTLNNYTGTISDRVNRADTTRSWFAWSAGLRTLTPVAPRLRFLAEITLGQASVDSHADLFNGQERYDVADDSFLIEIGAGLQYRLTLNVSLGARVDLAIPTNLEDFDLLAEIAGGDSADVGSVNPSFLATATLHL